MLLIAGAENDSTAHPHHPHLIFLFLRLPPEAAFDSSSSRPKMDPSEVYGGRPLLLAVGGQGIIERSGPAALQPP